MKRTRKTKLDLKRTTLTVLRPTDLRGVAGASQGNCGGHVLIGEFTELCQQLTGLYPTLRNCMCD